MLLKNLNLVLYRSAAELKSEATRTYAGYLWWILDPLLSLGVYYVAFNYIFHRKTEHFAVFLFSGIVVYRFFSGTVVRGAGSIIAGHSLMYYMYFHKILFPLSVVVVNLIKFLITLLLVIAVVWISGFRPTWSYLALPFLIGLVVLISAGVSLVCAALTPFFPDFQLLLSTILHLLIFLSGVFYEISKLTPRMQSIIRLNPLAVLIEQIRGILLYGQWPNLIFLLPGLLVSILLIVLGWWLIHKFNRYYPKLR
jgi:lipopolysaccharide transport system permease protein